MEDITFEAQKFRLQLAAFLIKNEIHEYDISYKHTLPSTSLKESMKSYTKLKAFLIGYGIEINNNK